MNDELLALARTVGQQLLQRGWLLASAESCTGGWVAQALTAVAGSSQWFERGFVTYSNQAKHDMLDVDLALIAKCGAVSVEVAEAMVRGALTNSKAQVTVATTGIAGPDGGSIEKPVGTVCFAWGLPGDRIVCEQQLLTGDRQVIRAAAVAYCFNRLLELLALDG